MIFFTMPMTSLTNIPQDVYTGDFPNQILQTAAPFHIMQLGVDPTNTIIFGCTTDGDAAFTTTMAGQFTVITTKLPTDYQQTCCDQFIYGRTLNKKCIVAWKYPLDIENKINRQFQFLTQALYKVEADRTDTEKSVVSKEDAVKLAYKTYNEFVESIPT